MKSSIVAKMKLPLEFQDILSEDYNKAVTEKILGGMSVPYRRPSVRINTLKSTPEEVKRELALENIQYEEIQGLRLEDTPDEEHSGETIYALSFPKVQEDRIRELDIYKEGKIYMQGISSMVPPIVLDPKPGERILDLTAAPGSKTTQMAAMMHNQGEIVANEIDKIRFERLQYNIKMQGATIVKAVHGDALDIEKTLKKNGLSTEKFDKVLLDAPCSGEGRILANDPQTYKHWKAEDEEEFEKKQRKLLSTAFSMVKPNGIVVYSTCTMNHHENENLGMFGIIAYNVDMVDTYFRRKGLIKGDTSIAQKLKYTIKLLPNKRQEGFFVIKFKARPDGAYRKLD